MGRKLLIWVGGIFLGIGIGISLAGNDCKTRCIKRINKIVKGELIIHENSSYKCQMIKTLHEK